MCRAVSLTDCVHGRGRLRGQREVTCDHLSDSRTRQKRRGELAFGPGANTEQFAPWDSDRLKLIAIVKADSTFSGQIRQPHLRLLQLGGPAFPANLQAAGCRAKENKIVAGIGEEDGSAETYQTFRRTLPRLAMRPSQSLPCRRSGRRRLVRRRSCKNCGKCLRARRRSPAQRERRHIRPL